MISEHGNSIIYAGDGETTEFSYPFDIHEETDIHVILVSADGTQTELTSDYIVNKINKTVTYPGYAPGQVPAEPPQPVQVGERLCIYSLTPVTQDVDLPDKWPYDRIEAGMDKLTIIEQQNRAVFDRAIVADYTADLTGVDLRLPTPTPSKVIVFDETGKKLTLDDYPSDLRAQVAGYASDAESAKNVAVQQAGIATQSELNSYAINKGTDIQVQALGLEHSCEKWNTLTANNPNVIAVAENLTDIGTVAEDINSVVAVGDSINAVNNVSTHMVQVENVNDDLTNIGICASNAINIVTCANNMPAITAAPTYAQQAQEYAQEASESAKNGHVIGEIVPVIGCTEDYIPHGCVPADGTEFSKSQFPNLWDTFLTADTPLLMTCSYADYATAISTYGQCAKWAVDTVNEKFKVPLIKDGSFLQQALSNSELGKCYNAGLPNIEGGFSADSAAPAYYLSRGEGAFLGTGSGTSTGSAAGSGTRNKQMTFDASLSNPIYGSSTTVQPNSVTVRYFVCVASGSVNQSMMDWSAYMSALQGKANTDLSNVDNNIDYVVDSYNDEDGNWYRVYKSGWVEQGMYIEHGVDGDYTVNLLKPYINNKYTVIRSVYEPTNAAGFGVERITVKSQTASNFVMRTDTATNNIGYKNYIYCAGQGATL